MIVCGVYKTMRENSCFFTGPRKIPEEFYASVQYDLIGMFSALAARGVTDFLVCGEPGFNTMAAVTVCPLIKSYPRMRLVLVLSCRTHEREWELRDNVIHDLIARMADEVVYVSERCGEACRQTRDMYLAGHAAYMVNCTDEYRLRTVDLSSE